MERPVIAANASAFFERLGSGANVLGAERERVEVSLVARITPEALEATVELLNPPVGFGSPLVLPEFGVVLQNTFDPKMGTGAVRGSGEGRGGGVGTVGPSVRLFGAVFKRDLDPS